MNAPETARFFEELEARGNEPLFSGASGTIRWEVFDGDEREHWLVDLANGNVTVSQSNDVADATATVKREISEDVVTGKRNAIAGYLRGAVDFQGDMGLAMWFQRLFPGPPTSKGPMA